MNYEKMGQFISELRKSHQMTQKDLAEKLHISDKAISKWERGLSCPDISLLMPLSDIFGITTTELLNGEKVDTGVMNTEESVVNVLQYADKTIKIKTVSIQNIFAVVFSVTMLIGIMVCTICNIAISGTFTWSLIPISSILFTWILFYPVIKYGKRGIIVFLIALSILIIPFLAILSAVLSANGYIVNTDNLVMVIGVRVSAISIVYLWIIYALTKLFKTRILILIAVSLLISLPMSFLINVTLAATIDGNSLFDVWDAMSYSIIIVAAIILFIIDKMRRK